MEILIYVLLYGAIIAFGSEFSVAIINTNKLIRSAQSVSSVIDYEFSAEQVDVFAECLKISGYTIEQVRQAAEDKIKSFGKDYSVDCSGAGKTQSVQNPDLLYNVFKQENKDGSSSAFISTIYPLQCAVGMGTYSPLCLSDRKSRNLDTVNDQKKYHNLAAMSLLRNLPIINISHIQQIKGSFDRMTQAWADDEQHAGRRLVELYNYDNGIEFFALQYQSTTRREPIDNNILISCIFVSEGDFLITEKDAIAIIKFLVQGKYSVRETMDQGKLRILEKQIKQSLKCLLLTTYGQVDEEENQVFTKIDRYTSPRAIDEGASTVEGYFWDLFANKLDKVLIDVIKKYDVAISQLRLLQPPRPFKRRRLLGEGGIGNATNRGNEVESEQNEGNDKEKGKDKAKGGTHDQRDRNSGRDHTNTFQGQNQLHAEYSVASSHSSRLPDHRRIGDTSNHSGSNHIARAEGARDGEEEEEEEETDIQSIHVPPRRRCQQIVQTSGTINSNWSASGLGHQTRTHSAAITAPINVGAHTRSAGNARDSVEYRVDLSSLGRLIMHWSIYENAISRILFIVELNLNELSFHKIEPNNVQSGKFIASVMKLDGRVVVAVQDIVILSQALLKQNGYTSVIYASLERDLIQMFSSKTCESLYPKIVQGNIPFTPFPRWGTPNDNGRTNFWVCNVSAMEWLINICVERLRNALSRGIQRHVSP